MNELWTLNSPVGKAGHHYSPFYYFKFDMEAWDFKFRGKKRRYEFEKKKISTNRNKWNNMLINNLVNSGKMICNFKSSGGTQKLLILGYFIWSNFPIWSNFFQIEHITIKSSILYLNWSTNESLTQLYLVKIDW